MMRQFLDVLTDAELTQMARLVTSMVERTRSRTA
jgi:hypothetical protein